MGASRAGEYPSQYQRPLAIGNQIEIIAEAFSLDPRPALALVNQPMHIPEGAEGLFAIARYDKVGPSYGSAVERAWQKLEERSMIKISKRVMDADLLKQRERSYRAFLAIVDRYVVHDCDILIVPAQFGLRHAAKSVARVRQAMRSSDREFGLGVFDVACMALTNPERFATSHTLDVDMPGDDYGSNDSRPSGQDLAITMGVIGGRIVIAPIHASLATVYAGSATGFLG